MSLRMFFGPLVSFISIFLDVFNARCLLIVKLYWRLAAS